MSAATRSASWSTRSAPPATSPAPWRPLRRHSPSAGPRSRDRRLVAPLSENERGDALGVLVNALSAAGDFAGALETAEAALAERRPAEPRSAAGRAPERE